MTAIESVDDTARLMSSRWGRGAEPRAIDARRGIIAGIPSTTGGEIWAAPSEGHIVNAVLEGSCRYQHWRDDRPIHFGCVRRGFLGIEPAGTAIRGVADGPIASVHIYLPHADLVRRAARSGRRRVEGLTLIDPRTGEDADLEALMLCFADAIAQDCQQQHLYRDSLLDAIVERILLRWSNLAPISFRGGLAQWQVKRVCELMDSTLDSEVTLEELADLVGLSPTHLSRAFKQSTGLAPFHWLAERRVDRAKALLAEGRATLAEIALDCGFAAQPQFTTAFRRATGMTPGRWRRERRS